MHILLFLILFFMGAALGSFLGLVADRRGFAHRDGLFSRSHADCCHHLLSAKDLIPCLSFLLQQGRCRYCHHQIAKKHFIREMLAGIMVVSLSLGIFFQAPIFPFSALNSFLDVFFLYAAATILYVLVSSVFMQRSPDSHCQKPEI
jgi:prepilin signal peptidase PulO-like enzyme (type II secretory pathway)